MAATMAPGATAPDRRSLLDLSAGPMVLVGVLLAAITIYANAKRHAYGFDFQGGLWAAGRDVLAGQSPYPAPDPAKLQAVGNAYIPPPLLAVLSVPLSVLPFVPALVVWDVVCAALVPVLLDDALAVARPPAE